MARTGKQFRPLTPADVIPSIGKISIPVVNYDESGRPTLGHKTIDLLKGNILGQLNKKD
jgi:hypothetical protein